jgi:hypothetical protein
MGARIAGDKFEQVAGAIGKHGFDNPNLDAAVRTCE